MPRTLVIFAIRATSRFSTRLRPMTSEVSYPVILQSMDLTTRNCKKCTSEYQGRRFDSSQRNEVAFFTRVDQVHNYRTRSSTSESYYIPKVRTNYGLFNIRYQGPTIWNSIPKEIRYASLSKFKNQFKNDYFLTY